MASSLWSSVVSVARGITAGTADENDNNEDEDSTPLEQFVTPESQERSQPQTSNSSSSISTSQVPATADEVSDNKKRTRDDTNPNTTETPDTAAASSLASPSSSIPSTPTMSPAATLRRRASVRRSPRRQLPLPKANPGRRNSGNPNTSSSSINKENNGKSPSRKTRRLTEATVDASQEDSATVITNESEKPVTAVKTPPPVAAAAAIPSPPTATTTTTASNLRSTLDAELRVNIGNSLRCGICLSTVTDPYSTPCVHVFCKDCLFSALRIAPSCPECKSKISSKRACQPNPTMEKLAASYKQALKEFAFTPSQYTKSFTTLTQMPGGEEHQHQEEYSESFSPCLKALIQDTRNAEKKPPSDVQTALDRYDTAKVWEKVCADDKKLPPIFEQENQEVVRANKLALEQTLERQDESYEEHGSPAIQFEYQDSDDDEAPPAVAKEVSKSPSTPKSILRKPGSSPLKQAKRSPSFGLSKIAKKSKQRVSSPPPLPAASLVTSPPSSPSLPVQSISPKPSEPEHAASPSSIASSQPIFTDSPLLTDSDETLPLQSNNAADDQAREQQVADACSVLESDELSHPYGTASQSQQEKEEATPANVTATRGSRAPPSTTTTVATQPPQRNVDFVTSPSGRIEMIQPTARRLIPLFATNLSPIPVRQDSQLEESEEIREHETQDSREMLPKGTIVKVQSRTWPGVNKIGGVARITNVNHRANAYNVMYVLGGRESNVDAIFISAHQDDEHVDDGMNETSTDTAAQSRRRSRRTPQARDFLDPGQDDSKPKATNAAANFSPSNTALVNSIKSPYPDLPPELLAQLAKDGFDTAGLVPGAPTTATSAAAAAVPAATTSRNRGRKRTARVTEAVSASNGRSAIELNSRSKKKGRVQSESAAPKATTKRQARRKASSRKADDALAQTKIAPPSKRRENPPVEIPTFDRSKQCQLAGQRYRELFEAAAASGVVNIVASNLDESDMALLKSECAKSRSQEVQLKLSDNFTKNTTMCVMPVDSQSPKNGNITARLRTLKAMRSAMNGIPIVSPTWIHRIATSSKIVVPIDGEYIRSLPTKATSIKKMAHSGVVAMASIMKWADEHDNSQSVKKAVHPLSNCHVLLPKSLSVSKRADMAVLVKEAGGKVLPSAPFAISKLKEIAQDADSTCRVVLFCDDSSSPVSNDVIKEAKQALKTGPTKAVMTVRSAWLFDCIACATAVKVDGYKPVNAKAIELWAMAK